MLTGDALDCGTQPNGTSPILGWSVIAVKPSRKGGGSQQGGAAAGFFTKIFQMDIKTLFFDVLSEFQEDSEDVSAGINIILKNLLHKNFVRNLTSKLVRSTLTSPSTIRVKLSMVLATIQNCVIIPSIPLLMLRLWL